MQARSQHRSGKWTVCTPMLDTSQADSVALQREYAYCGGHPPTKSEWAVVCHQTDEGRDKLIVPDQFVCRNCGSDGFKPNKLAVCLRDFNGAICQKCETIVSQSETNAEFFGQMERVIDEVLVSIALKRKRDSLFSRMFKRTDSPL